jgi:endonuclease/exonuclease/phosphatase (EEP) superfamily protein YafD
MMSGAAASSVSLCRKVAVALTVSASAALLVSALGRYFWVFDLVTHFRPHLAAVLFLSSTTALFCGERRLAIVGLLLVAAAAVPIVGYTRARPLDAPQPSSAAFRLVTFNIWHHNSETARVARFFEQTDADVLVIQEATPMHARLLQQQLPSYRYSMLDGTFDDGTIVFSRWPIEDAHYVELVEDGARAASIIVRWRDHSIQVVGVHLHWPLGPQVSRFRNAELQGIAKLAKGAAARPLLVAGDFNISPWSSFYGQFVRDSNLIDADLGQRLQASWPSILGPFGMRIDHCLHSEHWDVVTTRTGPELGSDHLPVIAELHLRDAS